MDGVVQFICADVFELLPKLEREGEKFDVVILDPPACNIYIIFHPIFLYQYLSRKFFSYKSLFPFHSLLFSHLNITSFINPKLEREGEKFDVVILDPPAFTKSRNSVKNAVKGYREINLRGMKLVKDGGFLATCSCSHFMTPEASTPKTFSAPATAAFNAKDPVCVKQSNTLPPLHNF